MGFSKTLIRGPLVQALLIALLSLVCGSAAAQMPTVERAQRSVVEGLAAAKAVSEFSVTYQPPPTHESIRFEGNVLIPSIVLGSAVRLPTNAEVSEQNAKIVAKQILEAYRNAGYVLAQTQGLVVDDEFVVLIAEGKINKTVIVGASDFTTLNMRYEFQLPGNTYNRFQVAKETERLAKKYGFTKIDFEVVSKHRGEMLFNLHQFAPGLERTRDDQFEEALKQLSDQHDLVLRCRTERPDTSFGYGLRVLPPFGLELYTRYRDKTLLLEDDVFEVGGNLSGGVDSGFTRASADAQWQSPPIVGDWLVPGVKTQAKLTRLSRGDLDLDRYWLFETIQLGRMGLRFGEDSVISLGVGVRYDNAFRLDTNEETPDYVNAEERVFGLTQLDIDLRFPEPGVLRLDKTHFLRITFTNYDIIQTNTILKSTLRYQKAFTFGYNDLFFRSRIVALLGEGISWQDEITLGSNIIKVVPGDVSFTPRTAQVGAESRLSVYRDLVKLNVIAGVAGYSKLTPDDAFVDPSMVFVMGPGLSLMILDVFAIDAYYPIGVNLDGDVKAQFSFDIKKVF